MLLEFINTFYILCLWSYDIFLNNIFLIIYVLPIKYKMC
jgi:hypothetical protein